MYFRSACDEADSTSSSGLHGRVLSTFLNELDGIMGNGNSNSIASASDSSNGDRENENDDTVLVIAACQDISGLDEALLRPG